MSVNLISYTTSKNNELKNYRIHRSSFSILGDLFLGSEEEIKVSNSPIK